LWVISGSSILKETALSLGLGKAEVLIRSRKESEEVYESKNKEDDFSNWSKLWSEKLVAKEFIFFRIGLWIVKR
jgi:hypothetical protein